MARIAVILVRHSDSPDLILHGKRRDDNKWSAPSGHVNEHESFEEGAKRELFEETGIKCNANELVNLKNGSYNDHEVALFEYIYDGDLQENTVNDPDEEFSELKFIDPRYISDLHVEPEQNIIIQYLYGDIAKSQFNVRNTLADKFIDAAKLHHDAYRETNDQFHFDRMNHYLNNATNALKEQHGTGAMSITAKKARSAGIRHQLSPIAKKELNPKRKIKLVYNKPAGSGPYGLHSVYAYAPHPTTGKMHQIGSLTAEENDGSFIPDLVHVEPEHRRTGIATAMYDHMIKQTGLKYQPDSENQSKEGKTFSQAYTKKLKKTANTKSDGLVKSEDLNKAPEPYMAEYDGSSGGYVKDPDREINTDVESPKRGDMKLHEKKLPNGLIYKVHKVKINEEDFVLHTLHHKISKKPLAFMRVLNKDGNPSVSYSSVNPKFKGKKLGKQLYSAAIMFHGNLNSDSLISPDAHNLWQDLRRNPQFDVNITPYDLGYLDPHTASFIGGDTKKLFPKVKLGSGPKFKNARIVKSDPLTKAKEDSLLPKESRKEYRKMRRKMDPSDPLASQLTSEQGVSDVGIEVRRGDKKIKGAISHGYGRVSEPSKHIDNAKKYWKKRLGKTELSKMSRPVIQFPKLKTRTRHDQDVQLIENERQKKIFGKKFAQAVTPDTTSTVVQHSMDDLGAVTVSPIGTEKISKQKVRDRTLKHVTGRLGRRAFGIAYDQSSKEGGFKSFAAAIAGKLRSKFENTPDTAYDKKIEDHKAKVGKIHDQYMNDIDKWRNERRNLIDSGASLALLNEHNSQRPILKIPRTPTKKAKDTATLSPDQQALRGKTTDSTIQHEAAHSLFSEIKHKHGEIFSLRVQKHLLESFPKDTLEMLHDFVRARGYRPSSPFFREEMLNHARDILVNPTKRADFEKFSGSFSEGHMKQLKRGWQMVVNRAKEVDENFGKTEWKDKISGGLADDKKPEDFDTEQLESGKTVEMEHTSNPDIATEIAQDHLSEDKDYYKKLKTIEKSDQPVHHLVQFKNIKPSHMAGQNPVYILSKDQLGQMINDYKNHVSHLPTGYPQKKPNNGFHGTAISRKTTKNAAIASHIERSKKNPAPRNVLYVGIGKDESGKADLINRGSIVDAYDPYNENESYRKKPEGKFYDEVHSHYTMNVLTPDQNIQHLKDMHERLKDNGKAVISTRWDIKNKVGKPVVKSENYFKSMISAHTPDRTDEDSHLSVKHSPMMFALAEKEHEKNRIKGMSNPFYRFIHRSDQFAIDTLNRTGSQLEKDESLLPKVGVPAIQNEEPVQQSGKQKYWNDQLKSRLAISENFDKESEKQSSLFPRMKPSEQKKALESISKRKKYNGIMLDTVRRSANSHAENLPPPIHISDSNSKLLADGIIAFDIMPDASCPGAQGMPCLGNCYFMKGQSFHLPANMENTKNNTAASARDDFSDRMIEKLHEYKKIHSNLKHVRVHSGGDMYHQDYVNDWEKIAKAHPDLGFYIYTKSHHLNLDGLEKLKNFTINRSAGSRFDKKLPEDKSRVDIAPNREAFDALIANGWLDASESDLAAATNKDGRPLALFYHTGGKDKYNHRTMLSGKARQLLQDTLGEEKAFRVERKNEWKKKNTPPKQKKAKVAQSTEQMQRKLAKLQRQADELTAQLDKQKAAKVS